MGESIDDIAELSAYVCNYLEEYENGDSESISVEDVTTPLQEHGVNVKYNGNREAEVEGDPGLRLVTNTMSLNGKQHGKEDENYQMWAEVEEEDEEYRIDFWDSGTGLPEEYDPEQIFEKEVGQNSGRGLYLAKEIVEEFDGTLEYSDRLAQRENGFGLEMHLKKA